MAITCCAPIGNTLSSNSTKNSPASCATSFAPTTCATSGCRRDSIIWRPCAPDSRPLLTASPASRPSASMCMSTSPCSSAWPCPSTSDRSVIPESRSTTPASSVYSRFCCTAATPWVAGPPDKSTRRSSLPFSSPPKPMTYTNCATIYANSRATLCSNPTAPAMPTTSPPKETKWSSSFCSSPRACAVPSPTAASTTLPIQPAHPPVNSNLLITEPTKPSKTSSTYLLPHDVTASNVEVFLSKIFDPRI